MKSKDSSNEVRHCSEALFGCGFRDEKASDMLDSSYSFKGDVEVNFELLLFHISWGCDWVEITKDDAASRSDVA